MKIESIEAINAANGSNQVLTLDLQSVLDFSDSVNDLITAGTGAAQQNSLLIKADAGDTVRLAQDGNGTWAENTGQAFDGYDVYAFTASGTVLTTLAIDDDATVVENFT